MINDWSLLKELEGAWRSWGKSGNIQQDSGFLSSWIHVWSITAGLTYLRLCIIEIDNVLFNSYI
jgi:hypothetical protein